MYPLPDDARLFARRVSAPRIRAAIVATLGAAALAVPVFAQADPGLSPSASLAGCSPAGATVQCSIAYSFDPVEGATYYTATLTTPGGAVIPYGAVGAGSGSISFIYAGDGPYSVSISAYGTTEDARPEKLDSADADADVSAGKASEQGEEQEKDERADPGEGKRDGGSD